MIDRVPAFLDLSKLSLCTEIAAANPGMDDETLFEQSRANTIAVMQSVTAYDFLPAVTGYTLSQYTSGLTYDPELIPAVYAPFAGCAAWAFLSGMNSAFDRGYVNGTARPVGPMAWK